MAIKGILADDHIPLNTFQLIVLGLPPLTILKISGIEQEVDTAVLPDRTVVSGGGALKTIEFTVETPAHHTLEQVAWRAWFFEGVGVVLPTYKKAVILQSSTVSGGIGRAWSILGCFVSKFNTPDFDLNNEGELSIVTHSLKADQIIPTV